MTFPSVGWRKWSWKVDFAQDCDGRVNAHFWHTKLPPKSQIWLFYPTSCGPIRHECKYLVLNTVTVLQYSSENVRIPRSLLVNGYFLRSLFKFQKIERSAGYFLWSLTSFTKNARN